MIRSRALGPRRSDPRPRRCSLPSPARWRVLGALALTCAAPLLDTRPAAAQTAPPIRGMALGLYAEIRESVINQKLDELAALGTDHVSLVVSWSTRDVRSTTIAPRKGYTTTNAVLRRMIKAARARGLRVFLFPILDVQRRKPLEWRGTIKPTDWDAWWLSYRAFILHYARLAAAARVELFCVGSELVSTEKMRDRWKSLIGAVRGVYSGRIVYSANWDHYEPVSFWDLVDLMGITGYYKVARTNDATEAEMLGSWRRIRHQLGSWSRKTGRKFLFTEVGYPSMDGGAVHPWDYTLNAPADPEEQRRAFSAFVRAWSGATELAGVFFWDWYGDGGPDDTRYTVRGKPAAEVVRRWFRAGRGRRPTPQQ